jgi:hypothetical protein
MLSLYLHPCRFRPQSCRREFFLTGFNHVLPAPAVTRRLPTLPFTTGLEGLLKFSHYFGTFVPMSQVKGSEDFLEVERVQTGVRLEKRMLKVLKAIAEQKDMTLGDLLEGIVLHAFEGKAPFSTQTLKEIGQFKALYGMTLKATDSHNLKEKKR